VGEGRLVEKRRADGASFGRTLLLSREERAALSRGRMRREDR
jgi:hypothetical protein